METRNSNKYNNIDLRTKKQWEKEKKTPISEDVGEKMYTNGYRHEINTYYRPEEVRPFNDEELKLYKEARHQEYIKRKERNILVQQKLHEEEVKYWQKYAQNEAEQAVREYCIPVAMELIGMADEKDIEPCDNPSGIVVFDTETTGLSFIRDEILQISAIDGDGNVLINTYVKPYWTINWDEAARVNGITKEMLEDAPYPHQIIPRIKGIFESAETLVAYNIDFDLGMLRKWGIITTDQQWQSDVMLDFAKIYGEWNDYYGDYKWQKLTTCAAYYGFEFKAHDSLEDTRATLYCYRRIQEHLKKVQNDIVDSSAKKIFPSKENMEREM